MRIIDADEVIKYLDQCLKESDNSTPIVYATLTAIKCYIEDAPTVDVMRCKYSVCGSVEAPLWQDTGTAPTAVPRWTENGKKNEYQMRRLQICARCASIRNISEDGQSNFNRSNR